jgi:uncharacterized protein YndB with AHSA1/START domain
MRDPTLRSLEFTRVFDAPRAEVFAAFIDPEAIRAWWAPAGWHTPYAEMDVRVGGRYRFGMRADDHPALMHVHGEYLVVQPPEQLVFTYIWEPGGAGERWREFALIGVPTTVTLRFRDLGRKTELLIRHAGFPNDASCEQHRHGWWSNWDCLEAYVLHHTIKLHARA